MREFPEVDQADRELLAGARDAARSAAEIQREDAPGPSAEAWAEKGPADFVTEVDRESERRIVEVLRDRFPDHSVVAEEDTDAASGAGGPGTTRAGMSGRSGASAPVRWIVDPLDGTTNWLHGYPEYAVSIAALDAEGPRVGLVLNSATGERFEAVRGAGAWRDGERIRVSEIGELRLALIGTGFPFKKRELLPAYLETFSRVLEATSGIRRAGSAALDLCHLACGRLDAFWEAWLMPWDVAAGSLILREAGGAFRPLRHPGVDPGDPPAPEAPELRAGAYLASNARLLEPFERLIRGG